MRGFTPGPWRIGNLESYDAYTGSPFRNVWAGDGGGDVVVARCIDVGPVDENARLIAAAPDLLAALNDVVTTLNANPEPVHYKIREAITKARAAIDKATQEGEGP